MNKFYISFLLIISVLSSCTKEKPLKSPEKELQNFTLEHAKNKNILQEDVEGIIEGSTIQLFLPKETDLSNLVASFDFIGQEVLLNDVKQVSGVTKNNYNDELNYQLVAEDGSKLSYQIVIEYLLLTDSKFLSFSFKKDKNDGLSKDYNLNVLKDTTFIQVKGTNKTLISSFETNAQDVKVDNKTQVSSITENDFSKPITYVLTSESGAERKHVIVVEWENAIPQFFINTLSSLPITSKDDYVDALLEIDGVGVYDDFEASTEVRGRGNSTWSRPKKPYRIKLNKKASILGLASAKNWVLLAENYDETLMLNSVSMKIGRLLGVKYANHTIPVELTVNGEFLGQYTLTEQVEVKTNRIEIEDGGLLLEMDTYFKRDWKFRTPAYNLPVQIKYPKLKNYSLIDANAEHAKIKADFEEFESRVYSSSFPNSGYLELFDREAFVDYLIVYMLTANGEINHPKSTFIHKAKEGKYTMGPLWDFDWAFSFNEHNKHFIRANDPLFWTGNNIGTVFFKRLLSDPSTKNLLIQKWSVFKSAHFNKLIAYVDEYAELITESQKRDQLRWNMGSVNFENDVNELKSWLNNRANYLDQYITEL